MVVVDNLVKLYPDPSGHAKAAVAGVSFRVDPGEIFGLLGPNGAGKTTTLRILGGLISASSGSAVIGGHDVGSEPLAAKRCLGYLTASTGLYQRLSPREVLTFFGQLNGLSAGEIAERARELFDYLDMHEFADLRCGALSTGQRQRTSIARALIANPPVLILDEPTLGLDVLTNRLILEFIRKEASGGKAIVLSTHYLDEAERLCSRFGLLHAGKLLANGTLAELRERSGRERLHDIFLHLCGQDRVALLGAPAAENHP